MSVESESNLKIDLLKQFLSGEIGGVEEMEKSSKISRLIIAGDSISPETTLDSSVSSLNFGSKNVSKLNVDNIKEFDNFLQDLLPTIPITLMPGSNDPGEICLPQQPLHRAFLQKNKQYVGGENLQSVTNPTWLESDSGLKLLGSSGQNIDDIKRYLTRDQINEIGEERLESVLLEYCLKWQNIAPSAPDTLYCYPFEDSDPFTLSETPHIFFAGNQDKFGWEKVYFNEYGAETKDKSKLSITVVSIPRFSESGQLVLIDEETLECEAINF